MYVPGVPPPGGDQNKAPMLRAVIGSELTLATIIVLLRFYTRLKITRSPGVEDYIMLGTFIFALTGTTMALIGMEYGIGRHIYYLPHDDGILATKLDWLCQAFFITALTGGKISVAFLILRISNTKWHTYFLHTINIALLIINLPLIVWTANAKNPSCKGALLFSKAACHFSPVTGTPLIGNKAFGAATDLLYALFPILIIWPLQMPPKRKYQLAGLMCLGSFFTPGKTSSASCMSPAPICHPANSSSIYLDEATSLLIWYNTEMYVIIIAGSLPTLRPRLQKSILSRPFFARRSSKGYLSHNGDYGLHIYPNNKKHSMRGGSSTQNGDRSSDQEILADGITKTVEVDYTISDASMEPPTPGCRTKRREMWEDVEAGCKGLRENARL
ncbi:MAG: hypothetical protein LQ341_005682 [Variospora aurantia]|nr:MAG: hypothetical protein LQ341_005682 [Variospora aurantia]